MSIKKQAEKIGFIIQEIINNYFVTDQKMALLLPLLEDNELFTARDNALGVHALEALKMTLYMAILSDIRALLFDPDKKTASMCNVIYAFEIDHYASELRKRFCKPTCVLIADDNGDEDKNMFIKKQIQATQVEEAEKRFDELLPNIIERYKKLEKSDLSSRVINARNKMISHKEIQTTDGERALYNPTDFGLRWDDAQEIMKIAKGIVFDANLLIHNSSYGNERFEGHREISATFWAAVKIA